MNTTSQKSESSEPATQSFQKQTGKTTEESVAQAANSVNGDAILTRVLDCLERDLPVIPLCWPDAQGQCACPKKHTNPKEIGKAPLLGKGYQERILTREEVEDWWRRYPQANYGILIKPSGLFVLDADSFEADREIEALGVSPGPRVRRGDHIHRYFKNDTGLCGVAIRQGKSGKVDILANGYVLGPGSLHRSGMRYIEEVTFSEIEMDSAPLWAKTLLLESLKKRGDAEGFADDLPPVDLDSLQIPRWLHDVILYGQPKHHEKYPSRSEAVWAVVTALVQAGYDTATIASILLDPCFAISAKPRAQGPRWLAGEIGRARAKTATEEGASSFRDETNNNSKESESTVSESAWPVLAEEALYGLPGDIVKTIDPYTEADPVAVLLNVLAAFGNCINAAPHARVQHDNHPARLSVVQVGNTSKGRKGTGWSTPRYLFSLCDADWSKTRVKSGLSSGEGLIYNVRDPRYAQVPRKEKGKFTGEYDTVCVDEGETDKRLLVVEPEFASVLTVANREGSTLSEILRQAWDSGNLSPMTKNNPIKATGAHISLLCHITKQELLARLDDTSKANGFANRFLWALVRRSKELPEGGAVPDALLLPLADRLSEVITFARTVSEVKRDENARALWAAVYHDLSEGKPGLLGAILSRAEAQVLRLSLIYALLDKSTVIKIEHLQAALAVWEYCERSAVLIFSDRLGDPTADRILEAIRTAGPKGMTDNDIYELFAKHKSANERTRAINLLLSLGLIEAAKEETGGRPRTVYKAA